MNESARKPIAIFITVLIISLVLLVFLSKGRQPPTQTTNTGKTPPITITTAPKVNATATLLAVPTKSEVAVGEELLINVIIQTGENVVTGVQAEMRYDPSIISVVEVAVGDFFAKPLELANKHDSGKGEIIYAVGSFDGMKGGGVIAKITAKALKKTNGSVEVLTIAPTTLISAFDAKQSVLKEGRGASLVIR